MPTILVACPDETLATTRRWLLQKSGYDVVCAHDLLSTFSLALSIHPDLILFCYLFAAEERRAFEAEIHACQPYLPVLCLDRNRISSARFLSDCDDMLARGAA